MTDIGDPIQKPTTAETAVEYVLRRIAADPRIAYYFHGTESLRLLTRAHAEANHWDAATYHCEFIDRLTTERPVCRECSQVA